MPTDQIVQFDYDAIDEALAAPESVNASHRADIAKLTAERMSAQALHELLRWIVVGAAQERYAMQAHKRSGKHVYSATSSRAKKRGNVLAAQKRFCALRIGRRAIAAAWVIDAALMGGLSLNELSKLRETRTKRSVFSKYAVEFKDRFGIQARGMMPDHARSTMAKAAIGNASAKKVHVTLLWKEGQYEATTQST
jgi:hypothetical protein